MSQRFVTLADLHRDRCNLMVTCTSCGRINTLMTWVLAGRVGAPGGYSEAMETMTIADVIARMRCSSCGSREIEWTPVRTIY